MYRGFNITDINENSFDDVLAMKKEYCSLFSKKRIVDDFVKPIESYLKEGVYLDGDAIKNGWFPSSQKFDVFLSHSGADENITYAFAYWLSENFNLTSFIDSFVWNHFSGLKNKLDIFFIKEYGDDYTNDFRNRVYQHINIMLNTALLEVMDRSECLFFLNTPHSIKTKNIGTSLTDSPWLFSEISMFNNIQKKRRRVNLLESRKVTDSFSKIQYRLNLSSLNELNIDGLNKWLNLSSKYAKIHALDVLYAFSDGITQ